MMVRRRLLEDSHNHERWLVSYADFMTLLFGFFVVMYAISSVNEGKYRILSSTLNEVFQQKQLVIDPFQVGEPAKASSQAIIALNPQGHEADADPGDRFLESIAEQLDAQLSGMLEEGQFDVTGNDSWLAVNLDGSMLFGSGRTTLSEQARFVLGEVVALLSDRDNPVTVEGYTDAIPVSGSRYGSNWELSAARAAAVVSAFTELGIDGDRLAAVGYGEQHPIDTNATPGGRARNRRVTIIVAKDADVQRGLTTIGAARHDPIEMQWRTEGETSAGESAGVQALRRDDGSVLFTGPDVAPEQ